MTFYGRQFWNGNKRFVHNEKVTKMEQKQIKNAETYLFREVGWSLLGVLSQASYLEVTFPVWYFAESQAYWCSPSLDRVMVSLLRVEFHIGQSNLEDGNSMQSRSDTSAVPLRNSGNSQVSCFLCPTQPLWSSVIFHVLEFVKPGDYVTW